MLMTDRESVDFYNQVETKRRQIMEQRSSVMSGGGSVDDPFGGQIDLTKYEPPAALHKMPNITSEIIIGVVQSALENVRIQIQAERLQAQTRQDALLEEAEADTSTAASTTAPGAGQGEGQEELASPVGTVSIQPPPQSQQHHGTIPRDSLTLIRPRLPPQKRSRFGGISRILRNVRGNSESSSKSPSPTSNVGPSPLTQLIYDRLPKPSPSNPNGAALQAAVVECVSCLDDIPKRDAVKAICHHYCRDCFVRLIQTAVDNEAQWPPKCCLNQVPFRTIAKYVPSQLYAAYQRKTEEFKTPLENRLYCPEPDCGVWIPPGSRDLASRTAKCPKDARHKAVCTMCRGPAHNSTTEGGAAQTCPQDRDTQLADLLAAEEGWRRCQKCNVLVEHRDACQHMTCRCGAQFCYVCGAQWRTCACDMAQLAELKAAAARRREAREMRTEAEMMEERDIAEAVRLVAEFEREQERKEALRREERRRAREERRRREEEERRKREEERRREVRGRYEELRGKLAKIEQLQRTVLEYGHDREMEGLSAKAGQERKKLASEQERERKELAAASAKSLAQLGNIFDRELVRRVTWERRLEENYERVMAEFWADKIGGELRAREEARAFRLRNDAHMDEWWAWRTAETDKATYHFDEGTAIREELLAAAKRKLDERLEGEIAEAGRRQMAEGRWFELVVEERKRLLAEVETVEIENGREEVRIDEDTDSVLLFDAPAGTDVEEVYGVDLTGWDS